MKLDIEADKIPLFLKTLATNRFITVIRMEVTPVDSQLMQIQDFVYGNKPVVTLNLDCEALFLRQWTLRWMPLEIRRMLGIPDPSAPGRQLRWSRFPPAPRRREPAGRQPRCRSPPRGR